MAACREGPCISVVISPRTKVSASCAASEDIAEGVVCA